MNKLSILCATALLFCCLGSCSDEQKELIGVDIVEQYDVGFEIKEGDVTSTTYSFEVIPSDKHARYVCLYVDKNVIDKVPKQELPAFLVKELHKYAESNNKSWADYLASISLVGDSKRKLDNLLPGNMYELVVFGIKGEQLSRSASYRFFETLKADNVSMTFDVKVALDPEKPTSASVSVKPSMADYKWYFCSFPESSYRRIKESGMTDRQIAYSFLQEELRNTLPPQASEADIKRFIENRFYENERTLSVGGRAIKADTEYVYLLTALHVTEGYEVVFTSETTVGSFTTPKVKQTGTTFALKVEDIDQTRASLSISPSDPSQKYIWRYGAYSDALKQLSPEEHAKYIIDTNPYIFFEARAHGSINQFRGKLTPGTEHFLIAFGYEGGVCTEVFRYDFSPKPSGDPRSSTFAVEIAERTTDRIKLKVTPSDASVFYIPLLYPDGNDKESIKGRVIADMRRTLAQNVKSGYNPYATLWDIIAQNAILGESTPEWEGLPPAGACTLLILTFDREGIAAEYNYTPSYLHVPGFSTVTVGEPQVLGVFDGDEEKGSVFNNPYGVQGKAIMVIRYKLGEAANSAFATVGADLDNVDELDTKAFPDAEILKNRSLNWTTLRANKPYLYLLTEWGKKQMSFSYGLNKAGERGPITRISIKAADKSDIRPVDELKRLVEATDDTAAQTANISALSWWSRLTGIESNTSIRRYMPVVDVPQRLQARDAVRTIASPERGEQAEIRIPLVYIAR